MPTQFITNPRRSPDNRDYKFYSTYVNEAGERKITGGWEYREDAADAVREMVETCQNIGWPAESFKVYSRAFLVRSGIDPKVGVHWDNPPQGARSNPRRRNPASSRPSAKALSQIVSGAEAKELRNLMDSSSVAHVLRSASKMMDGFGVEYIRSSNDTVRTPDGLDYVNMGDTYDLTLVYDHNKGKYVVTSWGDIVEADMGLPKSRQRFAD
jgi:hypothetical protein